MEPTITITLSEYYNLQKIKEEHELLTVQSAEMIKTISVLKEQIRLLNAAKGNETSHNSRLQKLAYY